MLRQVQGGRRETFLGNALALVMVSGAGPLNQLQELLNQPGGSGGWRLTFWSAEMLFTFIRINVKSVYGHP